jgi:cytoskeletal protein CcmA (bactofilin family)
MNRLEDINPNFWDNDGKPLAGGTIEAWDDQTKQILLPLKSIDGGPLENPVPIESSGRTATPAYFDASKAYIVVKDKGGAVIKEFEYGASASVQGDMNVKGDIISERNLEAKGNAIAQNDVVAHGDLIVDGNAAIKNTATRTLDVTEGANINNLTAAGDTNTRDLNVDGDLDVSNKTTTKTLYAEEKIDTENVIASGYVQTKDIQVLGNAEFVNDIEVNGVVRGDLYVNGSVKVLGGNIMAVAPKTDDEDAEMPIGSYIFAYGHGGLNDVDRNNHAANIFRVNYNIPTYDGTGNVISTTPNSYYQFSSSDSIADTGYRTYSKMPGVWRNSGSYQEGSDSYGLFRRVS